MTLQVSTLLIVTCHNSTENQIQITSMPSHKDVFVLHIENSYIITVWKELLTWCVVEKHSLKFSFWRWRGILSEDFLLHPNIVCKVCYKNTSYNNKVVEGIKEYLIMTFMSTQTRPDTRWRGAVEELRHQPNRALIMDQLCEDSIRKKNRSFSLSFPLGNGPSRWTLNFT